MRFLEKLRIKKRAKTKLKTESQIRQRRTELYEIRRNWIDNGEKDISDIDAVIAEFNWILCEEKKQQRNSSSELQKAKRKIKKLEAENKKQQVMIRILKRD